MPTHQGKTQTDILIGGGGESIEIDASFEFAASYSASMSFDYKDNAPSGDNEDSSYELVLRDPTGAPLATFAAEYTCDPITGTATNVSSTRTNTFNPSPGGSSPSFPSSWSTYASRDWEISSTRGGSTFGGFAAQWRFASTVASGYSVSQSVTTQNDGTLAVSLSYSDAAGSILDVDVTCSASATASTGVTLGSPSVSDDIRP